MIAVVVAFESIACTNSDRYSCTNSDASMEPAPENVIADAVSPQSVQDDANGDVNTVSAVDATVTAGATGLDPVQEGAHGVVDI